MNKYITLLIFIFLYLGCKPEFHFTAIDLSANYHISINEKSSIDFSWKTKSRDQPFMQQGYRIIVTNSPKKPDQEKGIIWDSKLVKSEEQFKIKYTGPKLQSGTTYYFKVKVWNQHNLESDWSEAREFTSPLNYPEDWPSKWISYPTSESNSSPVFKKRFQLKNLQNIQQSDLFISGLGYYEAYLNGVKIGDHILDPGQSNYNDFAYYVHYPIPINQISKINNLHVMLGDGWYNQNQVWSADMAYGTPILIAQLRIKYKDGTVETISTDETWQWTNGPVLKSNIYAGEKYDANKKVDFSEKSDSMQWQKALLAKFHPPLLVPQFIEPIRVTDTLKVKQIIPIKNNKYVFDLGQNFAGFVRIKMTENKGQKITLSFAESLNNEKELDVTSTGVFATQVIQQDEYICDGSGIEVWQPRFTYHGFRYVEVEGLSNKPNEETLVGLVVNSDLKQSGKFNCSSPVINTMHAMNVWSIRSNIHSIPTDCPHREKAGWMGDIHSVVQSLFYNYDSNLFLQKYMLDVLSSAKETEKSLVFGKDFFDRGIEVKPVGIPYMIAPGKRKSGTASPDWGTAIVQIPWNIYVYYGDQQQLSEGYPSMKLWVEYISKMSNKFIVPNGLGDWHPQGGNITRDCPIPLSSTAFHYYDISILAKSAKVLGYYSDMNYYQKLMKDVKDAFNNTFFDAKNNSYGSQTANSLALDFGLVPQGLEKAVSDDISRNIYEKHDGFIHTGLFGIGRIFGELSKYGNNKTVAHLLSKTGYNSFPYMWEHYKATTMYELLPVDDYYDNPSKNDNKRSFNHLMNVGFDAWFYKDIAGINPLEDFPGFKKFMLCPAFVNNLENASAQYESNYGTIRSSWIRDKKSFKWEISIPENSSADLYIPIQSEKDIITINNRRIEWQDMFQSPDGNRYFILKDHNSGNFNIKVENN